MFGYEGVGQVILRMIAIFAVALVVVRVMGNRAVGQLSPFDFVLMVGIGDIVANVAMDGTEALWAGAEGLIGLLLLQQLLAYLALKNKTLRKWFEGAPVTLIENGRILRENFVKTQFNYDDLRQELHKLGMDITNVKDIKLARLESCGTFSVIKVPEKEPLTRQDFADFLKSFYENPLSPQGAQWAKVEQFMADIHCLAEQIRKQRQEMVLDGQEEAGKELH
ncbi:protein of unknown function DUF421 [Thermosinus carboxydivorans Nor1]|uniref:YetF C-terminal domain-containing protein n=1 Tax=Thermosinus carboxydivorans Nor1 TaxID=401526 RepID=A1HPF6_9FIRM|nr:YetF domain-containing protein [Thermosinus carboxydivorans]EAX48258.1 protein of unknown function DUF421 [Thermosinus carboxydivorans Nor1]